MPRQIEQFEPLAITNPNKAWVVKEFDKLLTEWRAWNDVVRSLGESADYDPQTCTEAIKDGWENLRKHEILREKTLVFLRNHISGAAFIFQNWPSHPHESNTSRLRDRVPNWIHRLEILEASIAYARMPESFWKEKGKELVSVITKTAPEKAVEIAASYLKNPLGE
jgi:hypothetical protein